MNIPGVKKLITVNIHSIIDIITNSSTEIFCTIKGSTIERVNEVIEQLMSEMECEACHIWADEHYEEDEDGKEIKNPLIVDVWYDYEIYREPCKYIKTKLHELLT